MSKARKNDVNKDIPEERITLRVLENYSKLELLFEHGELCGLDNFRMRHMLFFEALFQAPGKFLGTGYGLLLSKVMHQVHSRGFDSVDQ